jgi:hypothetical protein
MNKVRSMTCSTASMLANSWYAIVVATVRTNRGILNCRELPFDLHGLTPYSVFAKVVPPTKQGDALICCSRPRDAVVLDL